MSRLIDHAPSDTLADVEAGLLPERYRYRMQDMFLEHLRPLLVPGMRILDVGSGRTPSLGPEDRPEGCHYIGLDISEEELLAAGPGAYDESFAHDITKPLPAVRDVDLVISWQVLEHVSSLPASFSNLHAMLRPGGTMLVQLSGSFAAFALAARVVPHRLRVRAMVDLAGSPRGAEVPHSLRPLPRPGDQADARVRGARARSSASSEPPPTSRCRGRCSGSTSLTRSLIASRSIETLATHYLIIARA